MRLEPFAMERMQSTYENLVDFNLSESGVVPVRVGELMDDAASRSEMLDEALRYTQTNGTEALRTLVASLYPSATAQHVQITNGGAEANYLAMWRLVEPGDEVVFMTPNYMQTWGLAGAFGGRAVAWPLDEGDRTRPWSVDVGRLGALMSSRTKLIVVCNPNNPTGARFEANVLDRIAEVAMRHGAWILSDEIYRGAERDGRETASMWGRSDRVVVTGGLSKAYGLPGLRIGWAVGPPALIESLWTYHDYTTIAPGALSDLLARRALEPAQRARLLARTRTILNENFPVIAEWLDRQPALFSYAAPDAGAIVYLRYHHAINSTDLATRLRSDKSVLIVPGDHFAMDGYLRIGFGERTDHLRTALSRISEVLTSGVDAV